MTVKFRLLLIFVALFAVPRIGASTLDESIESLSKSADGALQDETLSSIKRQSIKQVKTRIPGIKKIVQGLEKQLKGIDKKRESDVDEEDKQTTAINDWSAHQIERVSKKAKCGGTNTEAEKQLNSLAERYTAALASCTEQINYVLDNYDAKGQEASSALQDALSNLETNVGVCGQSDSEDSTCRSGISKQLRALSKPESNIVRLASELRGILSKKYTNYNCVREKLKEYKASQLVVLAEIRKLLKNEDDCDDSNDNSDDDDDSDESDE